MVRILTIIGFVLVFLLAIFLFCLPMIKKYIFHHRFRNYMGKKVYRLARDFDYCLLQNVTIEIGKDQTIRFDHILFGNKYIYCITDKLWDGAVLGSARDATWIYYYPKSDKRQSIKNPIRVNQTRLEKLALRTGIDANMMINIVVVNDDCMYFCVGLRSDTSYIISSSKFAKLIQDLESRELPPFEEKAIEKVVEEINQLNIS